MERKVIQIGEHTKLLTLPVEFTRRWNVKKGDTLQMHIAGKELVVRLEAQPEPSELVVPKSTHRQLERWYAMGFDLIRTQARIRPDPELFTLEYVSTHQQVLRAYEPSCTLLSLLEKARLLRLHYPKEKRKLRLYLLQAQRLVTKELPKNPFSALVGTLLSEIQHSDVDKQLETISSLLPHTRVEA
jgi:hypothetical protein